MQLTKDGITIELTHPADIARYKHLGYVEVEVEPKVEKPKAEKSHSEKANQGKKGGDEV